MYFMWFDWGFFFSYPLANNGNALPVIFLWLNASLSKPQWLTLNSPLALGAAFPRLSRHSPNPNN